MFLRALVRSYYCTNCLRELVSYEVFPSFLKFKISILSHSKRILSLSHTHIITNPYFIISGSSSPQARKLHKINHSNKLVLNLQDYLFSSWSSFSSNKKTCSYHLFMHWLCQLYSLSKPSWFWHYINIHT